MQASGFLLGNFKYYSVFPLSRRDLKDLEEMGKET